MLEAIAEKQVCEKCGVDVRENTIFCYACGHKVEQSPMDGPEEKDGNNGGSENVSRDTKAALDDLSERFKTDGEEDDRLAKAAAERRKARVTNRKTVQYVWVPGEEPNQLFLGLAVLIAIVAGIAVLLTVWWK